MFGKKNVNLNYLGWKCYVLSPNHLSETDLVGIPRWSGQFRSTNNPIFLHVIGPWSRLPRKSRGHPYSETHGVGEVGS